MRHFLRFAALSACILVSPASAQSLLPGAGGPAAPAAPVGPTPLPLEQAVLKAATDLLADIGQKAGTDGKILLAIDPLIDGVSGQQSRATESMERQILRVVAKDYPRIAVVAFNSASLEKRPMILIGTFTPVNNAGASDGPKDAYRICLALADLKTNKIISKGVARATPEGVDATPTASFADSPVWVKDPETEAYIKSCQGTKPGDPIDRFYTDRIAASALISDGMNAYNDRKYLEAAQYYQTALATKGGDQLRSYNGLYLANWRLKDRSKAKEAFGRMIDYSLDHKKLAVLFLFRPASTDLWAGKRNIPPYSMWLEQIATHAAVGGVCMELTGHTTKTGLAGLNDRLSVMRAEYIAHQISRVSPPMTKRVLTNGVGSRENLIGTGADNASDALDRRVEFKVIPCI